MVGFEDFESINKFSWIPLELIDFFRIDSRTYVAKKQSKWMARKNNAHFMQLDRNRHSDTKIYIHGRGSQRQYFAEKADGEMWKIDDMKSFRTEERVRRTGNTNYYRRFRWGVSASLMINDFSIG